MKKETTQLVETPDKASAFVHFIAKRCQQDKGLAAALRRADNPATEYQSWEVLAGFQVELDKPWQRLPYAAIAAAIAKAKIEQNGSTGIGRAIASCYEEGNASDQAKAKLRRLLSSSSVEEACRILRPLFSLIENKSNLQLDYSRLLKQLLKFNWQDQQIKSQWAQDFYGRSNVIKDEIAESAGGTV